MRKKQISVGIAAACASLSLHAGGFVSVEQTGDSVEWVVTESNFHVESVLVDIRGPNQSGSVPVNCTNNPFSCNLKFTPGAVYSFSTLGLDPGNYVWELDIVPLQPGADICPTEAVTREAQGGAQGLEGSVSTTPEEDRLQCLINEHYLPSADQSLRDFGVFTIADAGLIVPEDPNSGGSGTDNTPPVAICTDILLVADAGSCTATGSVDGGSYDPDGAVASIVQSPAGPYALGINNVQLTVTDDSGDSDSCPAVVEVVDEAAPLVQCTDESITPPDAPISFSASGSDACGAVDLQITTFECYRINGAGKRIDTSDSCVVSTTGGQVTVTETSGVGSMIDWTVEATDGSGNVASATCTITVENPGNGKGPK